MIGINQLSPWKRRFMNKQVTVPIADPTVRDVKARISKLVKSAGGRALFVGGCVRDALLGTTPKDFDVEIYGIPPKQLIEMLSSQFPLDLVWEAFGVIKLKGIPIDISLPRRESKRGLGHKGFEINSDPSMTLEEAAGRPRLHDQCDVLGSRKSGISRSVWWAGRS